MVTTDEELLGVGLLYAGVMLHGKHLRKRLVTGALKEQLINQIGARRLTEALRYDIDPPATLAHDVDRYALKAFGLAVMYRYTRAAHMEAGRRLLRRFSSEDPVLRPALCAARRLATRFCSPIGNMVLSSLDLAMGDSK
ncbi:hypothetical protein [Dyella monticola]|uniref:hypothetical protein n=1 Tax=Dyella monticola TaxID=1927958 RepID=UPI0011C08105|nr:hypothetical protein [Dyella monticola]